MDGINARHLQAPLLLRLGKHDEAEALLGTWAADTAAVMQVSRLLLRLAAWGKAGAEDSEAKEAEAEAAFEVAFAANWHAVRASPPSHRPPAAAATTHAALLALLALPPSRAAWLTPARVLCRQCVVLAAQETAATFIPENMCNALREQRAEAAQQWATAAAKARAGQPVAAVAAAAAGGVEEALLLCDTFGGWSMDEEAEEEGDAVGWPGLGAGDVWLAGQVLRQAAPTKVGIHADSKRSVALFNGAPAWPCILCLHCTLCHRRRGRRRPPAARPACLPPPAAARRCPPLPAHRLPAAHTPPTANPCFQPRLRSPRDGVRCGRSVR